MYAMRILHYSSLLQNIDIDISGNFLLHYYDNNIYFRTQLRSKTEVGCGNMEIKLSYQCTTL